jgi:tetratricopeptide (TPR) repeat protein/transcriptional regulator with XRE-family HTH domain
VPKYPNLQKNIAPRGKLRLAREAAGWSQHEFGKQLGGVTQVTISRWESGETTPSPHYRKLLCDLLRKTSQELDLDPSTEELPDLEYAAIFDSLIPPPSRMPVVGREREIALLKQHLWAKKQAVITAVNGLPGVGKTTLAVALAHDKEIRAHFYDGILWVGLGTTPNIVAHLSRWGTLLGLPESHASSRNVEQLALTVRSMIGARRMLLVIDDAWKLEDALIFQIGGTQCVHLVTTRIPSLATALASGAPLVLNELNPEQSLDLLHVLAPQVVEHEIQRVRTFVQAVGGLPLALTLAGNYLRLQTASGQVRRISAALEQLSHMETRLHLSEPRSPAERHPSLPFEQPLSLHAMISLTDQHLSIQARTTLYSLSVLPAKPESFSEEAALAISGCPLSSLDELLDAGLLESVNQRYTFHQTITDYARLHLESLQPQEALIAYALAFVKAHQIDYELLDQEYSTILVALETAYVLKKQGELIDLACAFAPFLFLRSDYEGIHLHLDRAYHAALALNDQPGIVNILLHLGELAGRQGEYAQSRDILQKGLDLSRRLEDSEQTCAFLAAQGHALWKLGDDTRANEVLQEGLTLARTTQHVKRTGEILALLGAVLEQQGNYEQSEAYHHEGLALARQSGDRQQICKLLSELGVCLAVQGKIVEAETFMQEGLTLARQIRNYENMCAGLINLGDIVRLVRQDYEQAEKLLKEGLLLARKIGRREWACSALVNLAELDIDRGHYESANVSLEECSGEAAKLNILRLSSIMTFYRGVVALSLGQTEKAIAFFHELEQMIPDDDLELQTLLHYGHARLAASQGKMEQAQLLAEASAAAFEDAGNYRFREIRRWLKSIQML